MKHADDNHRAAAIRSLEEICRLAEPLGVRVAVEVIPNACPTPRRSSRCSRRARRSAPGICLDFGHAHLMGDVADAVETVAEHIITTHVHDNHGRDDEHLVPYRGSIDWDQALVTMQKIGYEGTYLMELAATGDAASRPRGRAARERTVRAHAGSRMNVYIEDIAGHAGQTVTLRGWLHNRRSSGKIHFLTLRDGTGFIQCVMSKAAVGDEVFGRADHLSQESAIIVTGTVRADARAPGGFELDVSRLEIVAEAQNYPITPKEHGVDFLMDHRHLWIRAPRQQAILRIRHEVINAVRDFFNDRGFILVDTPIFTPAACEGTTTLFPGAVLRRRNGVPDAERPALQRGQRDGARQGVLLRPDVPRREVEDPPPPDRVLDGRARGGVRRPRRRDGAGRGAGRLGRRRACSSGGRRN